MLRKHKYNATSTNKSDSKAEDVREKHLRSLVAKGIISNLVIKPQYIISPPNCELLRYTPDFTYIDLEGRLPGSYPMTMVAEDVKGMETPDFIIRAKLFTGLFPGIKLYISKAIYRQKDKKRFVAGFSIYRFDRRKDRKCQTMKDFI